MGIKNILKEIAPPAIWKLLTPRNRYGFIGNYAHWTEAVAASRGYDRPEILEKVRQSALEVKHGEAAFERDSIAFKEKEYAWPLLTSLLWISGRTGGSLRVLDFGGSLGSSYFQHKNMLENAKELSWNIVEQPGFVAAGKKDFEDTTLTFYADVDSCIAAAHPHTFMALSSLQYLEDPYSFMRDIATRGFEYIIIDRTPCLKDSDRITVQKVSPRIYGREASYPAWLINERRLMEILGQSYEVIVSWSAPFGDIPLRGFLLKKK